MLSFRHTNSVVKIHRTTGQILWTLGGRSDDFGLGRDEGFSHQHFARIQLDGSLTIFDDGNAAHQTRAISFTLDQPQHQVTAFEVLYRRPTDQPATTFMGSATRLAPGTWPGSTRSA